MVHDSPACTCLRAAELQEPPLALLLRYLLHLHTVLQPSVVPARPGQELAEALLLGGRDPAPLPVDHYNGSLREADVQAVIQCTGAPRIAAVNALRQAGKWSRTACTTALWLPGRRVSRCHASPARARWARMPM